MIISLFKLQDIREKQTLGTHNQKTDSAELSRFFDSYVYPFSDPSVQIRYWLSVF
jgi:hypothetical protein